jgi:hypothetical protein
MNNTFNTERRCLEKVELDMLRPDRFVGLHAHSTFSTFDGLGYPADHINFVLSEKIMYVIMIVIQHVLTSVFVV